MMSLLRGRGKRDDHAKNFSCLYDRSRQAWRLSPGYDLTENPGTNGEHTTSVNGKGKNITVADLASVGVKAGISRARCIAIANEIDGFAMLLVFPIRILWYVCLLKSFAIGGDKVRQTH